MPRNAALERLVHSLLLRFSPELSHCLVGRLLRVYQTFPDNQPNSTDDGVMVSGVRFPNRLGLAAGFDKNAHWVKAMQMLGFGFVEVGTVTPLVQHGNPKPRLWRFSDRSALVNSMGFNNCGLERFVHNLSRHPHGIPVIANIGKGKDTLAARAVEDYQRCLEGLSDSVDGFVVNISSPNTPGLRDLQTGQFLDELEPFIPKTRPTWIKLAPDLPANDFENLCRRVSESRFAGLVLTNTSTELASELYGFDQGGLSGRPLFDAALSQVRRARKILLSDKSIIGVGGISSAEDARTMREAGADLIEIFSSFVFQGPTVIEKIRMGLAESSA